jgi:hypothetical protein
MNELNPFGSEEREQNGGAIAAVGEAREIAEVKAAMAVAQMHPRDQRKAMDRILNACARPTLAEKAQYAFARGGQEITGPSIRLAETIAQGWGHLQYGMRELSNVGGASEVEAYCWDLESNVRKSIQFTVSHVRNTKKGSYALTDSRDIYENVANNGARRVRACILAIVPGDVVEAAEQACEQTLRAKVDISPERIAKLLEAFAAFGVDKEAIEKKIQRRMDSILPAQVVSLGRIYNSLRDGMSKPHEWFDVANEAPKMPEDIANLNDLAKAAAEKRAKA